MSQNSISYFIKRYLKALKNLISTYIKKKDNNGKINGSELDMLAMDLLNLTKEVYNFEESKMRISNSIKIKL